MSYCGPTRFAALAPSIDAAFTQIRNGKVRPEYPVADILTDDVGWNLKC